MRTRLDRVAKLEYSDVFFGVLTTDNNAFVKEGSMQVPQYATRGITPTHD